MSMYEDKVINGERVAIKVIPDVYFMACQGFIKIGISTDPGARRYGMQTSMPFSVMLLAVIPHGGRGLERELHLKFDHLRTRPICEWFRAGPELMEYISEVIDEGA